MFSILVAVSANSVHADSLRCGNRLVSLGDLTREVEDICGLPTFLDVFQEESLIKTFRKITKTSDNSDKDIKQNDHGARRDSEDGYEFVNERTVLINFEEWTYNFGSSRFIRTLLFKNGRLISIKEGGYGFDKTDRSLDLELGESKASVWMKYGPADETQKNEAYDVNVTREKQEDYLFVEKHSKSIAEEEWIYDLGPDQYLKQLIFKNNCLVKINSLKVKGKPKTPQGRI